MGRGDGLHIGGEQLGRGAARDSKNPTKSGEVFLRATVQWKGIGDDQRKEMIGVIRARFGPVRKKTVPSLF